MILMTLMSNDDLHKHIDIHGHTVTSIDIHGHTVTSIDIHRYT
jgi:hypothetical protein